MKFSGLSCIVEQLKYLTLMLSLELSCIKLQADYKRNYWVLRVYMTILVRGVK